MVNIIWVKTYSFEDKYGSAIGKDKDLRFVRDVGINPELISSVEKSERKGFCKLRMNSKHFYLISEGDVYSFEEGDEDDF